MKQVIIGGGIVGACTALFGARKGTDITIIEKETIGSGASSAAAGILAPPSFLNPETPPEQQNSYALLSQKGHEFYPDFLHIVQKHSDIDPDYAQPGSWYVDFREEKRDELRTYVREMKSFDRDVSWYSASELQSELPWLSPDVIGGYYVKEDARIRPDRLMDALKEALSEQSNVTLLENTKVEELITSAEHCTAVRTEEDQTISADQFLLTAGCWSKTFESDLKHSIPVDPVKGERIRMKMPDLAGQPLVRWESRHVIPRENGEVDFGATVERVGFDRTRTEEGKQDIIQTAKKMVPGVREEKCIDHWVGLRPYARKKGGPFLGDIPNFNNVWIGAGHYKEGILQGPYSAKLLTELLHDEQPEIPIEPYHLNR